MGDVAEERTPDGPSREPAAASSSPASAGVICQEFLKVLGRTEVEQPMICQDLCICAQFWRYQHYLLPLWPWGITKIVCLDVGSFRNVQPNGGPFFKTNNHDTEKQRHTYRAVIRDKTLLQEFNSRPIDGHDALQAMLRHVAALEMASMLKFCSSRRGIEHQLIKYHFKKLGVIQDMGGCVEEGVDEKTVKKLGKMPPTAGYAGDKDLTDVAVYFCGWGYTAEDREALERLAEVMRIADLPPVEVVDGEGWEALVDERTMVYAVNVDLMSVSKVLRRSKPAAMIWGDHNVESSNGKVDHVRVLLGEYEEFKLDRRSAPHTVGSSHLYIRKDIAEAAEREEIVPPYPVTFPHGYPFLHNNWYLDKLERNGSGIIVKKVDAEK